MGIGSVKWAPCLLASDPVAAEPWSRESAFHTHERQITATDRSSWIGSGFPGFLHGGATSYRIRVCRWVGLRTPAPNTLAARHLAGRFICCRLIVIIRKCLVGLASVF